MESFGTNSIRIICRKRTIMMTLNISRSFNRTYKLSQIRIFTLLSMKPPIKVQLYTIEGYNNNITINYVKSKERYTIPVCITLLYNLQFSLSRNFTIWDLVCEENE